MPPPRPVRRTLRCPNVRRDSRKHLEPLLGSWDLSQVPAHSFSGQTSARTHFGSKVLAWVSESHCLPGGLPWPWDPSACCLHPSCRPGQPPPLPSQGSFQALSHLPAPCPHSALQALTLRHDAAAPLWGAGAPRTQGSPDSGCDLRAPNLFFLVPSCGLHSIRSDTHFSQALV